MWSQPSSLGTNILILLTRKYVKPAPKAEYKYFYTINKKRVNPTLGVKYKYFYTTNKEMCEASPQDRVQIFLYY